MNVYLTRTERSIPDGMGGEVQYYNNLYTTYAIVDGRTEDGMYAIYTWEAVEIDPRTGLSLTYLPSTIIEEGEDAGQPLGVIDDNTSLWAGIISKVSLIVPTSPGSEVTP